MIYLFGPPRIVVCDEATEFTSAIVHTIHNMLNCTLKVISPYNHGSSKCKRQIKTISEIIVKRPWDKGKMWPLFTTTAAYAMNTFASEALSSFSPFQLVFLRDPTHLTSLSFPKIDAIPVNYCKYFIGPLFIDTALDKIHYRLKDVTGLLLDGRYHMDQIKEGSACTLQGIVSTFVGYKKALKKFAIKTPDNKIQEVTLEEGSKDLNYFPGTIMDYTSIYG